MNEKIIKLEALILLSPMVSSLGAMKVAKAIMRYFLMLKKRMEIFAHSEDIKPD